MESDIGAAKYNKTQIWIEPLWTCEPNWKIFQHILSNKLICCLCVFFRKHWLSWINDFIHGSPHTSIHLTSLHIQSVLWMTPSKLMNLCVAFKYQGHFICKAFEPPYYRISDPFPDLQTLNLQALELNSQNNNLLFIHCFRIDYRLVFFFGYLCLSHVPIVDNFIEALSHNGCINLKIIVSIVVALELIVSMEGWGTTCLSRELSAPEGQWEIVYWQVVQLTHLRAEALRESWGWCTEIKG